MVKGRWIPSFSWFRSSSEKPSSLTHGVGGVHPQIPAPALDERPRADEEKKQSDGYMRTDNDRPLQDSLISSGNPPLAPPQYRVYRLCDGCNGAISYGEYLISKGKYYHRDCFRCFSCGYPITENEVNYLGNNQYHRSCFKELNHPKCDVCHQFIPLNNAGLIEYSRHPFWSQKYCPSHEHDNTAVCYSCKRLESWKAIYVSLRDGRSLCAECLESAVMDTGDCLAVYHAVRDFFEGLYLKLDPQIPLFLVDRQALDEAIVHEQNGYYHWASPTNGLCVCEGHTVSSRSRVAGNRLLGPQKPIQKTEITAILVLSGLPRLLTGATLADLLMHTWLHLNGYQNLSPGVEEGICQVLSDMWLQSEILAASKVMPFATESSSSLSSKNGSNNKLGEYFLYVIGNNSSPVIREGFRAANVAVNKYGLRTTLNHVRHTWNFPQ